mmetsp:Transcript_74412/g.206624  ORF Transcript_74412/g.206624 Transcript_74412/m.206624 type:complete len:143 (+) Transcript_74412:24-452(+)
MGSDKKGQHPESYGRYRKWLACASGAPAQAIPIGISFPVQPLARGVDAPLTSPPRPLDEGGAVVAGSESLDALADAESGSGVGRGAFCVEQAGCSQAPSAEYSQPWSASVLARLKCSGKRMALDWNVYDRRTSCKKPSSNCI